MPDDKQPESKQTVSLPAMTDRALLEDLARAATVTRKTLERLEGSVDGLVVDSRDVHGRMGRIESRLDRIENPSSFPPSVLTSTRVKAMINESPSQMDLELQAHQAAEIAKNLERDRKIAETHELATQAATKEDVKAIVDSTATKEEVKELVTEAAKEQTTAIVAGVTAISKDPVFRKVALGVLYAAGGAILAALATCSHPPMAQAPVPVAPTSITVTK